MRTLLLLVLCVCAGCDQPAPSVAKQVETPTLDTNAVIWSFGGSTYSCSIIEYKGHRFAVVSSAYRNAVTMCEVTDASLIKPEATKGRE